MKRKNRRSLSIMILVMNVLLQLLIAVEIGIVIVQNNSLSQKFDLFNIVDKLIE